MRRSKARYVLVGAANDTSALGAARAFQEAGRAATCAIVGQNGEPDARAELREPRTPLIASVGYFPERYGDGLLKLAFDLLAHRQTAPALFIRHQLITAENVDHFYPNDVLLGHVCDGRSRLAGPATPPATIPSIFPSIPTKKDEYGFITVMLRVTTQPFSDSRGASLRKALPAHNLNEQRCFGRLLTGRE